ncbi:MAG TPA: SIS domain-containing protein [Actinomycetota bacterium]
MPQTALDRQIRSQPQELERLAAQPLSHESVERLAQCHRIWLVGTGTSFHAAELGVGMFHEAGRAAQAIPSMQFMNWAPPVDHRDGVILISHNAGQETAFAAAAYAQAKDAGVRVLAITREGGGLSEAVETVPKETSQTYTVSYTAALVVLAKMANALGAESLNPEAVARVPGAMRDAIDHAAIERIAIPRRLLVLFGEGPASVTAREGALKLREAARLPAEGYDVEYLLHGSAVPLTGDDHLVALSPPDTNGLVDAVSRAAGSEGLHVTALAETADLPPILAQIPLTVRLQLLALRFAVERGQDPDRVITGAWDDERLWQIGSP